jgi:hypothetical protein
MVIRNPEIVFHPYVIEHLDWLGKQLYDKGYFGFRENAKSHIQKIVDFIMAKIAVIPPIPAPKYFNRYGSNMYYIIYNSTKQTSWYIFFQQIDNRFLVRHITNNHIAGQHIR